MLRTALIALAFVGFCLPAGAAGPSVSVELNKLESVGTACRAYLVLQNKADTAFATLKLDLVLFDKDGVVARRLAVETAPLTAGKTSLKVFDVSDQRCAEIGRVLLNDVMTCQDSKGPRKDCLKLVNTASRGSADFIK